MAKVLYKVETTEGNILQKRQYDGENQRVFWEEIKDGEYQKLDPEKVDIPAKKGGYEKNKKQSNDFEGPVDTSPEEIRHTGTVESQKKRNKNKDDNSIDIQNSIKFTKDENRVLIQQYPRSTRETQIRDLHNEYAEDYERMNIRLRYEIFKEDDQGNLIKKEISHRRTQSFPVGNVRLVWNYFENQIIDELIKLVENDDYTRIECLETSFAFKKYK